MTIKGQLVVLVILVIAIKILPNLAFTQAPITWPDRRHFAVNVGRFSSNKVEIKWPVDEYCPQNTVLDFRAFATASDGSVQSSDFRLMTPKNVETITLKRAKTEYKVTGIIKTLFEPEGVTAEVTIVSGAAPAIGSSYARPIQKVSYARGRGDGPHIVVLKDNSTLECLLVMYDSKSKAEKYTIESTNECRKGSFPKVSLLLPMEVEPDDQYPDMRLLTFDLPQKYLEHLPNFFVTTAATSQESKFELDPPQDVYGKLNLESPEEATLILKFRPPASHPGLIKSFTFEFSELGEKIIYQVTSDEVISVPNTTPSIKVKELIRVQENHNLFLEIYPKSTFKYPGKYTVTAYTNGAKHKRQVIPIIMPNFVPLAPKDSSIIVRGHNAEVTWKEPRLFGKSCTYKAMAKPTKNTGVPVSEFVNSNQRKAIFENLFPATEYNFTLESMCGSKYQILTNLGTRKTGPGVPGKVRNLQILVAEPSVVKLSWNPPAILEGDTHLYKYECNQPAERNTYKGVVNTTTVTIKNILVGQYICFVSTLSSVKGHETKEGEISDIVLVSVPSNLISSIPSVAIKATSRSAIELKIENANDVIAVAVDVDSKVRFTFYTKDTLEPINVTDLRRSGIRVGRKGLLEFQISNLNPRKTHNIKVTYQFFAAQNVINSYIVTPEDFDSVDSIEGIKMEKLIADEGLNFEALFVTISAPILLVVVSGVGIWLFIRWRAKRNEKLLEVDDSRLS